LREGLLEAVDSAGAKITKSSSPDRRRSRMIVVRFQCATARDTVRACEALKSGLDLVGHDAVGPAPALAGYP
jgi:hypothetical protein